MIKVKLKPNPNVIRTVSSLEPSTVFSITMSGGQECSYVKLKEQEGSNPFVSCLCLSNMCMSGVSGDRTVVRVFDDISINLS